jgi:hypothetical protein
MWEMAEPVLKERSDRNSSETKSVWNIEVCIPFYSV